MARNSKADTARKYDTVPLGPSARREMSVRRILDRYGDPLDKLAAASEAGDLKASAALLPYVYPALKAVEITGQDGGALTIQVVKLGSTKGHAGVTPAVEQP
jgi:hypothetical protein